MPSHNFTASTNSHWDMERSRLALGIARNHSPAETVPIVFRQAPSLMESMHIADFLSTSGCRIHWGG